MEDFISFLSKNYIQIISIVGVLTAVLTLFFSQRNRYRDRLDKKEKELDKQVILKLENEKLRTQLQEFNLGNLSKETSDVLIQEEKAMFVKFLYLLPQKSQPAYLKKIDRINEEIEIRTESTHYRVNRFNKETDITITDTSTNGIVDDMHVMLPWQPKSQSHKSRSINPKNISKRLSGSKTYVTISTYCNGFSEGEEDYAIMAERFTKTARLIIDFSSVPDLDKIFSKQPDAYRYFDHSNKKSIYGILEVSSGVYLLEANNLEKNEIIELDFHINWNYLTN